MKLEQLRRIVQEVDSAPSLPDALALVVRLVAQTIEADVCSIYLFDEASERYVLVATEGLNPEAVGEVFLGMNEGLVGMVGQREEIITLENASDHPRYRYFPVTGEERYHAFLGVPIMYRRKVMGVMVVQHRENRAFSEEIESFLVTLCAQLSGAIAHAQALGQADWYRKSPNLHAPRTFNGISGAGGIALGHSVVLYPSADIDSVPERHVENINAELELLTQAVERVRQDITELDHKMQATLDADERALFSVYLRMLDDQALPADLVERIREGHWAQGAVAQTIREHSAHFTQMEDAYLRERAADVRDLGRRLLSRLQENDRSSFDLAEGAILLGEDISTATLVELPLEHIAAIVTVDGAANSHMVIVARALGIPTVVGVAELPLTQLDDTEMIVDAHQGRVFINPIRTLRQRYKEIQREEAQLERDLKAYEKRETITTDGVPLRLMVNTGLMIDVIRGAQRGASGIGLYRSEMLFMLRERFPGEEEQRIVYRQQLSHFPSKPVVMRTLDIGADKDLPYFSIDEENAALGWRGIRFTLDHPEIFTTQIRAMLKASIGLDNLRILLPMVSTVSEVEEALYLIERSRAELEDEEEIKINRPQIGIMIEVPTVLFQLEDFAALVDFFSVGSNDLTQYLLAVDRNNNKVASLYSHYHPALLRALYQIILCCQRLDKPVSVCGEMAGDPASAVLLAAMGFDTLSMSTSNLLRVRKTLCNIAMTEARSMLDTVLQIDHPEVIRSMMARFLIQQGLESMVPLTLRQGIHKAA